MRVRVGSHITPFSAQELWDLQIKIFQHDPRFRVDGEHLGFERLKIQLISPEIDLKSGSTTVSTPYGDVPVLCRSSLIVDIAGFLAEKFMNSSIPPVAEELDLYITNLECLIAQVHPGRFHDFIVVHYHHKSLKRICCNFHVIRKVYPSFDMWARNVPRIAFTTTSTFWGAAKCSRCGAYV